MQSDSHVHRWRKFTVGRACAVELVKTLPNDGMTLEYAARWLRAMEATLRIAYDVPGSISIRTDDVDVLNK